MLKTEISITAVAENKIKEIISREGTGSLLRIAVTGGGCVDMQYVFSIHVPNTKQNNEDSDEGDLLSDDSYSEDVIISNSEGLPLVIVDYQSSRYMKSATIDYSVTLTSAGFVIHNSNTASSCGCGNSFSLKKELMQ